MLLFGSKKLPDLARGLGRSMRIHKGRDPRPVRGRTPSR
ncbi:twin-arginine translocase TatA/TatE family subunit [Kitasatospora sp. NPDC002965]